MWFGSNINKMKVFSAIVLLLTGAVVSFAQDIPDTPPSICSTTPTLHLDGKGTASSITLSLTTPRSGMITSPKLCGIRITAPETHFIHVRLVDTEQERNFLTQKKEMLEIEKTFEMDMKVQAGRRVHSKRSGNTGQGCPIIVFHTEPEEEEEEEDSSSSEESSSQLHNQFPTDACGSSIPLEGSVFLTNDIQVSWMPPITSTTRASRERNERLQNRKLVITAVGNGEVCKSEDQHNCITVGWTPFICVAKELMCDGVVHCPSGGPLGDENPLFCKQSLSSTNWERIATDFLKKITGKTKPGSLIPALQKENNKWTGNWKSTEAPSLNTNIIADLGNTNSTSNDTSFAQYGPWGYLMLGMLICGTVLTFCGLWECCCRRAKPHRRQIDSPTSSTFAGAMIPSTVLIMDQHHEAGAPPNYEDLDQPPNYNVLFPNQKASEAEATPVAV